MNPPQEKSFFIPNGPHRLASVLHDAGKERLVVMAHGFTGNKSEQGRLFVQAARAFAATGLSVLRFDFMGSGDSSGEFHAMTPNTEIADLHAILDWAHAHKYRRIGVLGLSFGGAVSICAVADRPTGEIAALCTWSSVPSFRTWRPEPQREDLSAENVLRVGRRFYSDRPKCDVPEAYARLPMPKLQIQGDRDLPGFRKEFEAFFTHAQPPKKHLVLAGADHVFTTARDRRRVIAETAKFFQRTICA